MGGGGGNSIVWEKVEISIYSYRNALIAIKISIIDICYSNIDLKPKTDVFFTSWKKSLLTIDQNAWEECLPNRSFVCNLTQLSQYSCVYSKANNITIHSRIHFKFVWQIKLYFVA